MNIATALKKLQADESIVIGDKTFTPDKIDHVQLETGEKVFWISSDEGPWLSIDPESEEVIFFEQIEEEFDGSADSLFYLNDDYEFSYETTARIIDEDGEEEPVAFREYEENQGKLLRIYENQVTGDVMSSVGKKLTEEELQEA